MEIKLDLTHLLNEENDNELISDSLIKQLFELDSDWDYSFDIHDYELSLILQR